MGKTYPFTQFYPILPKRFYPVGKTYHANPVSHTCRQLTRAVSHEVNTGYTFLLLLKIKTAATYFTSILPALNDFYPQDALHSAVFASVLWRSVCLSVRFCRTSVFCLNGQSYLKTSFDRLIAPSF